MKLKKKTNEFSYGKFESYQNHDYQHHGPYISFSPSGQKEYEGQCFNGRDISVWKIWYFDGRIKWIDTNKTGLNGIKTEFNYE